MSRGGRCESRDPTLRALRFRTRLLLATGLLVLSCVEEGKDPICTVTDSALTFCRMGEGDSADSLVVSPFDSPTIAPASVQSALPAPATVRTVQPGQSIQAALNLSLAGDTVVVDPGVYPGSLNFGGKDVTLVGRDGAEATTIVGTGGTAVVIGPRGSISGFTIRGGSASFGAGMSVSGTGSVISDNIFEANQQGAGGFGAGVGGNSASPTIVRNVFRNNSCDGQFLSAVLSFVNSSSPRIADNLFVDNPCRAVNLTLPVGNRPVVVNNTMVRNSTGIRFDRRISAALHVYANNILWANGIGLEVDFGTEANNAVFVSNLVSGNAINYEEIIDQTGSNGNLGDPPRLSRFPPEPLPAHSRVGCGGRGNSELHLEHGSRGQATRRRRKLGRQRASGHWRPGAQPGPGR